VRAYLYCDWETYPGQTLRLLESDLDDAGLRKIRVEQIPDGESYADKIWDVLFFDYGLAGSFGTAGALRELLNYADQNPSRTIVLCSQCVEYYLIEWKSYQGLQVPANLFANIKAATEWLRALYAGEPEPPPAPSEAEEAVAPGWGLFGC
jgi:hypothetical protein